MKPPSWWTGYNTGGLPSCDIDPSKAHLWDSGGEAIDALAELAEHHRAKYAVRPATPEMLRAAARRKAKGAS